VRTQSNAAVTKGLSVTWPIVLVRRLDARCSTTDIVTSLRACEPASAKRSEPNKRTINIINNAKLQVLLCLTLMRFRNWALDGENDAPAPKVYFGSKEESRRSRQAQMNQPRLAGEA
jgi:hypothetical protein